MDKPLPLFLTSLSLSSKTALGVQTKLLLEQFPLAGHLFWDASEFRSLDERSARLESILCARFSILRRDPRSLPAIALSTLGRSWWKGNELKPRAQRRLAEHYGHAISTVYAAPCSIRDSERMKSILMHLNRPFVLHLWDIQDKNQIDSPAFRWLVEHALHVLCLSEEMIRYLDPLRQGATIMRFARKPSSYIAEAPKDQKLRIALIGNCRRYRDGLSLLVKAMHIARANKVGVTAVYVGSKKSLKGAEVDLGSEVEVTGFVESDSTRDLLLSQCHVAFLPGPLASPSLNMFSRFSIPSRILDFMATGLPILAAVHPNSATATYLAQIGLQASILEHSAERLAERLSALAEVSRWNLYATMSRKAFHATEHEWGELAPWLENVPAKVAFS